LAGGTALAIQMGHRESIDLDWFSEGAFEIGKIKGQLSELGKLRVEAEEVGTLHASLDQVRVTFLNYPYSLLFPLIEFEGGLLADERDIAAMKLDAIASRGSKKDFIDLCFLLRKYSLEELLIFFKKKYQEVDYNQLHLLKSLSYFEDAEQDPMPKMLQVINWEEVKIEIRKEAEKLIYTKLL
jgi:hypothetical protein